MEISTIGTITRSYNLTSKKLKNNDLYATVRLKLSYDENWQLSSEAYNSLYTERKITNKYSLERYCKDIQF